MKEINNLKSLLFLLLLAVAGIVAIACNNEDEEQQAIDISFKTINEKGEYATVFSSKENILFDLNIKNNTGDTIIVQELFLEEIVYSFKLYTSRGKYIGYVFDGFDLDKLRDMTYNLKPYESRKWQCLYKAHQSETNLESPFNSTMIRKPLSQGEYYLLYSLTFNNETKTGKITFKIE